MGTPGKPRPGSFLEWIRSLLGGRPPLPLPAEDAHPRFSDSATAADLSAADLRELTRLLPDFIDSLEHRERGDDAQAALSLLAALPIGGNPDVIGRNESRITWASTVHGIDRLKQTALLARDADDAEIRLSKTNELRELLRMDDVDARTNAILEKLQQGQTPSARELAILKLGAELMRSDSHTEHGE